MNDVKQRYGFYPQEKWDKNLELRDYFEENEKKALDMYACPRLLLYESERE